MAAPMPKIKLSDLVFSWDLYSGLSRAKVALSLQLENKNNFSSSGIMYLSKKRELMTE